MGELTLLNYIIAPILNLPRTVMDFYSLLQHLSLLNSTLVSVLVLVFTLSSLPFVLPLRRRRRPPGPFGLPLIGSLFHLNDLPHISLQRLSNQYGPLMFLHLGSIPTLVISSANMAREVSKKHDIVFSGRPAIYSAKKLSYQCLDIAFAPYGEYWRQIRKIAILELLSAQKVHSFQTVRHEEVDLLISSMASSHGPFNLSEGLIHLSNDVVCRVSFGRKYNEAYKGKNRLHELVRQTQELLGGFALADFFPRLGWIHKLDGLEAKLDKNFRQLDEFYDQVIEEHLDPQRPKADVEDLVDVLLRLQRDPTAKVALTTDQIKGVLTDMFIAGTDTSSATVVWTMSELMKNPTVMRKAQEEVREVVAGKKMVEESDLHKLNYLRLVVKEAMRLHPPTPLLVPRETTEKCTIQGYEIPAQTRIFINAKAIMTDPKSWDNPQQFQPERFIGKDIDFKGQDYDFLPFGFGRRGCPGINFALVLVELVLASLLYHFNWELPQGKERGDVDMKEAFGLTMHKKIPLCLVAKSVNLCMNA